MIFRGKTKGGKWVEGYYVRGLNDDDFIVSREDFPPTMSDPLGDCKNIYYEILPDSLSMSTGLSDKNGKRIFGSIPVNGEMSKGGDVVKIPDDYETFGQFAGEEREVIFAYGGFWLKPVWDKSAKGNWLEDDNCFEIIGNQYEGGEV